MKDKLRFCLVGRGSIGTRHLMNLQSLSYSNIIAFSEFPNKDKDELFFKKYNTKTFYDLHDVRNFKPSAFVIANPTSEHVKTAKIAIDLDCHIFMEKPISHNLSGTEELTEGLVRKNLTFFLGCNLRFHPAFVSIKKLIDNNEFGNVHFARIMTGQYLPDWHPWEDYRKSYSAKSELGGGVVLTLQHEIDYAYWLFGRFKSLKSYVRKISKLEIDVEDIAVIIMETERGQMVEIHLDYLQRPPKRSIQIQGTKGSIDYIFGDRHLRFYDFNQQEYRIILDLKDYDNNQMYIDEMQHFINCITEGETSKISMDDAIYVLKTCLKVKQNGNIHSFN